MKPTVYVGVDPGVRGAIAILWGDGDVDIRRLPSSPRDAFEMFDGIVRDAADDGKRIDATIERPQPYAINRTSAATGKGISPNAQLSIMLKMGVGFGQTVGVMGAAGIWPIHRVIPQTWKAVMCKGADANGKAKSIVAAMALYGGSLDLVPDRGTKPDDNYADALLIAHYGRHIDQVPF